MVPQRQFFPDISWKLLTMRYCTYLLWLFGKKKDTKMYSFGLPKSLCISLVLNGSKKQNSRQLLVSIDFLDTKYIFVNQLYKSLFVFRDFNRGIVKQIDRALKTSDLTQQVCAMSLCKVLVIRKLAETLNMLSIWHHNQKKHQQSL